MSRNQCLLCGIDLLPHEHLGMQEHPVVDDCNTTLCDAWGVPADNLPAAATEDPTVASMFDLRVYPPIDVVLKQIFEDAGTARLGGVSSGRGWSSFCVTPETPVLTADLQWVPASELKLGQLLIGFDEEPGGPGRFGAGRGKRKLRPSTVLHTGLIERDVYRLELEDGSTVRASAEHPWLTARTDTEGLQWLSVEKIAAHVRAGHRILLPRFLKPWETQRSYDAGYLAGLFDGEGHLDLNSHAISVAQNPGVVLDKALALLTQFTYSTRVSGKHTCQSAHLLGGAPVALKFLGEMRPDRLLQKFVARVHEDGWLGEMPRSTRLKVVKAVFEGRKHVVALQTSTQTYFANGFGAHNSTFQKCPYLWYRKYILQKRGFALSESPALAIGTLVHVFLAVHYQAMIQEDYPLTPDQVYELSRRAGNPEFVEEAWRVFSAYRIYYSLETIQPLAVEYDLRDPRTGESCRYDLIMYMPEAVNGYSAGTYITEHKTASRFDREALEGWPNDGEVIGQVALWKQLGLDRRFGELKGVIINLCGKQKKQPQLQRVLVSPTSWQIEEHLKDLKRWEGLINLAKSADCFPRARAACVGRFGFCENFDLCSTGVE